MERDDVKVRRWSFCPECKGAGCGACNKTGKVSELVLLEDIPRLARRGYEIAQADFILEQLKGH